ncbi:ABC transporter substrate-binding protein [Enterococcus nangangensis]|uniref:ABC transporter substrate-binding protein n=1 Tax=Enterococcus nangangensis TaxID=2559926 RepID=UPI0010F677EB|nr:extracellular solute-binding protein [Enterococcus nangangensis]
MFKKKLFVAFSIGLAVLGLSACGSGGDSKDKEATGDSAAGVEIDKDHSAGAMDDFKAGDTFKATEAIDLPLMYSDHEAYPYQKDWLFNTALTEKTDVTIDPTIIPRSDYEQKRSLLISSGDAPYVITKTYPGQETPFVSSGTILPISDYVEYMPNYQAKVEQWDLQDTIDTLKQSNGKYYLLPGLHEVVWQDYTLAYRTDILEENGLDIPETWDDFYTVLKTLKEKYPDSYPFSDRWTGQSLLKVAAASFGTKGGWGYDAKTWDADKKQFVYTGTSEQYKEMVTYFNKLINEGLMDPESFTQDDDTALQKFYTGKSFVISTNGQELINMQTSMDSTLGEGKYSVSKGLTPEGPAGAYVPEHRLENGIMFSSKLAESKNFKATLQFIDWLFYSDEGQEFAKWGVEGTTYTKDGDAYKLAADVNFKGLNPAGTKDLQKDFGFSGGVYSYGGAKELVRSTMDETEVAWLDEMAKSRKELALDPPAPFDDLEQEQANLIATPVKDFVDQSTLQFIVGQRPLDEWDAYVKEANDKGATKYIDMVNKAHEEFEKNNE